MGRQYRLSSLQMRIGRQDDIGIRFAATKKRELQILQRFIEPVDRFPHPQSHVGGNLIVTTPAGVKFAASVSELVDQSLFNIHMNVFQFFANHERTFIQICWRISSNAASIWVDSSLVRMP